MVGSLEGGGFASCCSIFRVPWSSGDWIWAFFSAFLFRFLLSRSFCGCAVFCNERSTWNVSFLVSFVIPHKPSSIMEGMVCLMLDVWVKKLIEMKKNEIERL